MLESTITVILFFILTIGTLFIQIWSNGDVNYIELIRKHPGISEDGKLDFTGLAKKYGHPAEVHYVITEDGYNLTLFRLPGDRAHPALLVHGDTVDADCFIIRGNTSLAITLANKGYDVWVISLRGTIYSQRHLTIDPYKDPKRFFDFSYYELGVYDLPATIDHILQKTKQKQLLGIGYSIGTTAFYVMAAEKPEYNVKVRAIISLAPIWILRAELALGNVEDSVGLLVAPIMSIAGTSETFGRNQSLTYLFQSYCLGKIFTYDICVRGVVFGLFGDDEEGFEKEFMSTFFGHYPAGSTRKRHDHISQVTLREEFVKYDYGPVKNKQLYNSTTPPKIELSKVTTKVVLLVGAGDYLSTVDDAERLRGMLPNVVHHQILAYKKFNHFDFVFGRNMAENLYPYLLRLIEKYIKHH